MVILNHEFEVEVKVGETWHLVPLTEITITNSNEIESYDPYSLKGQGNMNMITRKSRSANIKFKRDDEDPAVAAILACEDAIGAAANLDFRFKSADDRKSQVNATVDVKNSGPSGTSGKIVEVEVDILFNGLPKEVVEP